MASNTRNRIKKQILLGSNGKAAVSAANKADSLARKFGDEIALRSGKTQDAFLKASRASVAAVKAAAKAGETRASNFAALKTKAERAMNNLLNKIVAP